MKFKERDEMEQAISSWLKIHPFDIEALRDQRLRAHFKTRYDFRKNGIDWDYSFSLKTFAKNIHKYEYTHWRMLGNAFDVRLASSKTANRTYGSYIEGKNKKSRDSILVRGFWGDILNSPYIPLGIEIDTEESKLFFKELNMQRVYQASDVSEYHVMSWIYKLSTNERYNYKFERLSQLGVDKDGNVKKKVDEPKLDKKKKDKKKKPPTEGCTVEEIKEEDEEGAEEENKNGMQMTTQEESKGENGDI
jgi:dynein assembly factor 3